MKLLTYILAFLTLLATQVAATAGIGFILTNHRQAPVNQWLPEIVGQDTVGSVLSVNTNVNVGWLGAPRNFTYTCVWHLLGSATSLGTNCAASPALTSGQIGSRMQASVTAHNSVGATTVQTNFIGPIESSLPSMTVNVTCGQSPLPSCQVAPTSLPVYPAHYLNATPASPGAGTLASLIAGTEHAVYPGCDVPPSKPTPSSTAHEWYFDPVNGLTATQQTTNGVATASQGHLGHPFKDLSTMFSGVFGYGNSSTITSVNTLSTFTQVHGSFPDFTKGLLYTVDGVSGAFFTASGVAPNEIITFTTPVGHTPTLANTAVWNPLFAASGGLVIAPGDAVYVEPGNAGTLANQGPAYSTSNGLALGTPVWTWILADPNAPTPPILSSISLTQASNFVIKGFGVENNATKLSNTLPYPTGGGYNLVAVAGSIAAPSYDLLFENLNLSSWLGHSSDAWLPSTYPMTGGGSNGTVVTAGGYMGQGESPAAYIVSATAQSTKLFFQVGSGIPNLPIAPRTTYVWSPGYYYQQSDAGNVFLPPTDTGIPNGTKLLDINGRNDLNTQGPVQAATAAELTAGNSVAGTITSTASLPASGLQYNVFSYACIGSDSVSHICLGNLATSASTQLTSGTCGDTDPTWSFDGTKLVFERTCVNAHDIYTINADGSNLTRITTSTLAFVPTFAPNGKIVYMLDTFQAGPTFCTNIYTVPCTALHEINADGTGDVELLSSSWQGTGELSLFNLSPNVTPDGTKVIFACGPYGSGAWGGSGVQLCSIPLASGSPTQTPTLLSTVTSAVSSDPFVGLQNNSQYQVIFDSTRAGNLNVFSMNLDGTSVTQLTTFTGTSQGQDVGFSPDMKTALFEQDVTTNTATATVYAMNADGTNQHSTGFTCNYTGCRPRFQPAANPLYYVVQPNSIALQTVYSAGTIFTLNSSFAFGNGGSSQGTITVGGVAVTAINSWNENQILAVLPPGAPIPTVSNVVVTPGTGGTVAPTSVSLAGLFTALNAANTWGSTQGTNTISVNGIPVSLVTSWGVGSITGVLPAGALTPSTSNVSVKISGSNVAATSISYSPWTADGNFLPLTPASTTVAWFAYNTLHIWAPNGGSVWFDQGVAVMDLAACDPVADAATGCPTTNYPGLSTNIPQCDPLVNGHGGCTGSPTPWVGTTRVMANEFLRPTPYMSTPSVPGEWSSVDWAYTINGYSFGGASGSNNTLGINDVGGTYCMSIKGGTVREVTNGIQYGLAENSIVYNERIKWRAEDAIDVYSSQRIIIANTYSSDASYGIGHPDWIQFGIDGPATQTSGFFGTAVVDNEGYTHTDPNDPFPDFTQLLGATDAIESGVYLANNIVLGSSGNGFGLGGLYNVDVQNDILADINAPGVMPMNSGNRKAANSANQPAYSMLSNNITNALSRNGQISTFTLVGTGLASSTVTVNSLPVSVILTQTSTQIQGVVPVGASCIVGACPSGNFAVSAGTIVSTTGTSGTPCTADQSLSQGNILVPQINWSNGVPATSNSWFCGSPSLGAGLINSSASGYYADMLSWSPVDWRTEVSGVISPFTEFHTLPASGYFTIGPFNANPCLQNEVLVGGCAASGVIGTVNVRPNPSFHGTNLAITCQSGTLSGDACDINNVVNIPQTGIAGDTYMLITAGACANGFPICANGFSSQVFPAGYYIRTSSSATDMSAYGAVASPFSSNVTPFQPAIIGAGVSLGAQMPPADHARTAWNSPPSAGVYENHTPCNQLIFTQGCNSQYMGTGGLF